MISAGRLATFCKYNFVVCFFPRKIHYMCHAQLLKNAQPFLIPPLLEWGEKVYDIMLVNSTCCCSTKGHYRAIYQSAL